MRALLGVLMFALATHAADPEPCPIPKDKCNAGDGERLWGLKVCGVSYSKSKRPASFGLALEFGRDLNPEEVKALNDALQRRNVNGGAKLEVHFFDEDGVVAYKSHNYGVQGDVTGRTGDAFRLVVPLTEALEPLADPEHAAKVKKVEPRVPGEVVPKTSAKAAPK
jgi:hypothetical protein